MLTLKGQVVRFAWHLVLVPLVLLALVETVLTVCLPRSKR